jgi:hypothetical protein
MDYPLSQSFLSDKSPLAHFLRGGLRFLALALFTVSSTVRAVSPPPDGGYLFDNTAEGTNALFHLTSGSDNTAIGNLALFDNTNGSDNTAIGAFALEQNTGFSNTATGSSALAANTSGDGNTATGAFALSSNTIGRFNTAVGHEALLDNVSGGKNTACGFGALISNTGDDNTAVGYEALLNNRGVDNTATGVDALLSNTTGNSNTAAGSNALQLNTAGSNNTANGLSALFSNNTGSNNTACGVSALASNTGGHDNMADGAQALFQNKTGSFNIALGSNAGVNLTGSNNIDIGAPGVAGESSKIRIGVKGTHNGTFIAGISGVPVSGTQVVVNANGKLGVATSSARFKEAIKPMDKASETILALKPVTFRYKEELDPDKIPQFGLVAEEVEKVNPDLIARDEEGKVMSVRYEAINAMLLNEFLKAHRKLEQQQATIQRQQKQIEALTAAVRNVSVQLELGKPHFPLSGSSHAGHPSDPIVEPESMKGQ